MRTLKFREDQRKNPVNLASIKQEQEVSKNLHAFYALALLQKILLDTKPILPLIKFPIKETKHKSNNFNAIDIVASSQSYRIQQQQVPTENRLDYSQQKL